MPAGSYFSPEIETMDRSDLDALIDERVRYTVQYAADHSPFYRHWFREHRINPKRSASMKICWHFPLFRERQYGNTSRP